MADRIEVGAIVRVAAVLDRPEWTGRLAYVKRIVHKHGFPFARLSMWPCGPSVEVSTVNTVPMVGLSVEAPPLPSGEVRRG